MVISKRLILVLAAVALAVAVGLGWPRGSNAAPARPLAAVGDPALADLAIGQPGGVRGGGKYVFFVLGRENSSHRWFMRFNSETGTLERLTPDQGWMFVDSTAKMR